MEDLDKRDFAARYADGVRVREEITAGRNPLPDLDTVSEFSRPFREWMATHLFNDVWNRQGLSQRDRCMITIGILASQARPELRAYLDMALDLGITKDELQEVLLQCVAYSGTLSGVHSFRIAEELFADRLRQGLDKSSQ